ncbi:MAG: AAA family ATPase [bacterium]|nr:AAA family ATPase [bacterium]
MNSASAKKTLLALSRRFPAVLLTGPAGCGKTALARECFPDRNFIDLEDPSVRRIASTSPRTFLMAFRHGAVINEALLVPGMIEAVRYHVDRSAAEPGRFILTSTRRMDAEEGMDDRMGHLELMGMSVSDMETEKLSAYNPFQIMLDGQLPEVLGTDLTVQALIDRILGKHILSNINISNLPVFRHFLKVCATHSSGPFSMNEAARESDISAPTAKTWISLMREYDVVNIIDSQVFFTDTGILCRLLEIGSMEELILSPFRTCVTKTFAVNELLRGRCSRLLERGLASGGSADFSASWKERYDMLIEPNIEITEETKQRIARLKGKTESKVIVLYLGDVTYSMGSTDCISFRDWSRLASEIDYFS